MSLTYLGWDKDLIKDMLSMFIYRSNILVFPKLFHHRGDFKVEKYISELSKPFKEFVEPLKVKTNC